MTRTFESGRPSARATSARTRKMPCVLSHTVSRSPSHSQTAPCGSSALWSATGVRYSRVMTTSAASRPAATSPRESTRGELGAVLPFGRTVGASGAVASATVSANGAVSYATTIACAAARASRSELAHTAATGWPA